MFKRSRCALLTAALLVHSGIGLALTEHDNGAPRATQQIVKRFDFDERPLGNYEELPMRWVRLSGPGLPAFSAGAFDDDAGHTAPPALRFVIRGGSAACEYAGELPVEPGCDYRVEAYVRTASLEHARAFVECALVDPLGDLIPGSIRVSELVGGDTDWRQVSIPLEADDILSKRVRLRLWVLQRYAWNDDEAMIDPIVRQDVGATAWFDDVALVRVPRLRIGPSEPGGVFAVGTTPELRLSIHNSTPDDVKAAINVFDEAGASVHSASLAIAASASEQINHVLPKLPRGWYRVCASLNGEEQTIVERESAFVVVPPVPFGGGLADDVGVVVPRWTPGADDALCALIQDLEVGSARFGLAPAAAEQANADYWTSLRQLVRALAEREVDAVGMLLLDGAADAQSWSASADAMLTRCAAFLVAWQVGDETATASSTPSIADACAFVHRRLTRLAANARMAAPRTLLDEPPATSLNGDNATGGRAEALPLMVAEAYHLPPTLPTSAIPWQLAGWLDAPDPAVARLPRWLTVNWERGTNTLAERRIELARRLLLARMFAPEREYFLAPFLSSRASGVMSWQPGDEYLPVRTLARFLADTQPLAAISLPHEATGVILRSGSRESLAIWAWTGAPPPEPLALCLGPDAKAWTLDADPVELPIVDGRALVPLRAEPLLITDIDSGLLRLELGVAVAPQILQSHTAEPRPVITFTNHYRAPLVGNLSITPPEGWKIEPAEQSFELQAGETLSVPLTVTLRPREFSEDRSVGLSIRLRRPTERVLTFRPTLRVDLAEARLRTESWWEGDDLIVEQRLANLAATPLRFNAFVQAPERSQLEGVFLDVPPGESQVIRYRLPGARAIAGQRIWSAIREIDGPRRLDQLVDVPK